jgi:glyoxylase-like metal-dependent hydrolase (beta-lactamase superfamily II)
MVVRFRLPSGLEVIGAPTGNFYGNGWDLGPTWNYAVLAARPFLVDSGRFGQAGNLLAMLAAAGVSEIDLAFVLISHGHEDHDGGLAELVGKTRLGGRAHPVFSPRIRRCPEFALEAQAALPAKAGTVSCRSLFHQHLPTTIGPWTASVDSIGDGRTRIDAGIIRCICRDTVRPPAVMGDEAVLVGDIVLPGITWPRKPLSEVAGDR